MLREEERQWSVLSRGSAIQQDITKLAPVATCSTSAQTVDPASDERSLWDWADVRGNQIHSQPGLRHAGSSKPANIRHVGDKPLVQPQAPPPMPNSERPPQARAKQQPREYLRCAQRGSDPSTCTAVSDHGLVLHMVQKHGTAGLLLDKCAVSTVQPV